MSGKQHLLKTVDRYYDAIIEGAKTFEVRKNDRAFQTGDELILERWEESQFGLKKSVPFQRVKVKITYLLQGGQFGIEPQFCVLGFRKVVWLPAEARALERAAAVLDERAGLALTRTMQRNIQADAAAIRAEARALSTNESGE